MPHIFTQSGYVEWIALVFLQRYWEEMQDYTWIDVHSNHAPEIRDIDFYVDGISADLKADTYFANLGWNQKGTNYKKRNSGNLVLETISTDFSREWLNDLRPDPSQANMKMGWMHTSRAEELWYYFLTLDNDQQELDELASGRTPENELERQEQLLRIARIHRDELLIIPAAPLKEWFFENLDRFDRKSSCNPQYHTWFRRVPRQRLLRAGLVTERIPGLAQKVLDWHRST